MGGKEQQKASPAHTQGIPLCDGTSVSGHVAGSAPCVSGHVDGCWGGLYICSPPGGVSDLAAELCLLL